MHGMKWHSGALLEARITVCVLLLSIACLAHRRASFASAQGIDFISIDCGNSTNTLNWTTDTLNWTTDGSYTLLGSNAEVPNIPLPYDTLRYFPNKNVSKSCYTFNTTTNLSYLFRAGFYYGDYDSLYYTEGLPTFDLLFEASYWSSVNFTSATEIIVHEMLARATSDTTSVCLARSNSTANHNPFISSLEIRPLSTNENMYSPVHENFFMKTNSRINFGESSNKSVRYPDDVYDRIWLSDQVAITGISTYNTTLSTNQTMSVASSNDSPPSKVMQTARSPNGTNNMSFFFTARHGPGQYYLAFYFAELDKFRSSPRVMDMYIDDRQSKPGVNLSQEGLYNTLEMYHNNYTVNGSSYSLLLVSNNTSSGPPIINAAESYFLALADQGTFDEDVRALEMIKSAFNLSIWGGDPCLPAAHKWAWLDCDASSPARVVGLNLSDKNLHGEIPSAIANLTALTIVDLHDNALVGNVPSSLASLQSLVLLDLSYNNLSGDFPTNFRSGINISTTGNPNLCRGDSCGIIPAQAPSSSSASNPGSKTGLIVGLVIAATIFLVGIIWGCIFYKRKLQRQKTVGGTRSAHWPPVPPFTEISKAMDPVVVGQNGSQDNVPLYSFADIQNITSNFEKRIEGSGTSGTLFHGVLSDGQEVVVKLLKSSIEHSPTDFLYQVTPLWYVNHKNLLRPIGFCAEMYRILIYEHVQKGSLYEYLHDKHALDWKTRLVILQQVAQGLEHLHYACTPSIVHGNLKSTNVLLSGDGLLAKVSDFGLQGLYPHVDATSGYLDPEYFATQKLTEKSDLYSFGVLMLEVICGRIPFDASLPREARDLVDWVHQVWHEDGDKAIADPCLHDSYNQKTLIKVVNLALQATERNASDRPTMAELVVELKEANKVEVGHHVAFLEVDFYEFSHSSDVQSPPAYHNGMPMDDNVNE